MNKNFKEIAFISFADIEMIEYFLINANQIRKLYGTKATIFLGTDAASIDKYSKYLNELDVVFKDVKIHESQFKNNIMISKRISNFTMARIEMYEHFPQIIDYQMLVFLDADTLLNKFIDFKFFYNIEKNYAFIDFPKNDEILKMKIISFWEKSLSNDEKIKKIIINKIENNSYFNAGILFINNHEKIIKLFNKCKELNILFDDQTMLNYYNFNHIDIIDDLKYNNQLKHGLIDESFIFHFSGKFKPLKMENLNSEEKVAILKTNFDKYYNEYIFKRTSYLV